jgi:hypothetical protein
MLLIAACGARVDAPRVPPQPRQVQHVANSQIGEIHKKLSEQAGYFDSDNLISNETSYLHALDVLRQMNVQGGAYIGVGPDQNFSYIAETKPAVAFMIDIRRDAMLQHLIFRSLFLRSRNRMEFLAGLIGARVNGDLAAWSGRPVEEIIAVLDTARRTPEELTRVSDNIMADAQATGIELAPPDLSTIRRFHLEFFENGLDIRYTSRGRPVRLTYPTLRQLILETDLAGTRSSYLATEERWRVVQELHRQNRILFVTGDLAGPAALRNVGNYLRELGLQVTIFYTSNVEQYLFQYGSFDNFAANALTLPFASNGVIIRSYFSRGRVHPAAVPGYMSVQLVQPFSVFAARMAGGGYATYYDLVN